MGISLIAFRKGQLRSLELIESCMEQDMPLPQDADLGSSVGNDWHLSIVEIPDALINSLTESVIPALEACRLGKGAAGDIYSGLRAFIGRAKGVVESCLTRKSTIAKVQSLSLSKQSNVHAVDSAQSLLRDMVMLLDDMHHVAADCEERACVSARPIFTRRMLELLHGYPICCRLRPRRVNTIACVRRVGIVRNASWAKCPELHSLALYHMPT